MTDIPPFRALAMLENEYAPLLRRRAPYWRPRPAACFRDVHTPTWSWTHPSYSPDLGMSLTYLDRNGAYLAAISSGHFAHGALEHTGALAAFGKRPGYYRIDAHPWQDPRIVSPLGSATLPDKVWVAGPTLELLDKLSAAGYWPELRIHDSWTCDSSVRMREWATAMGIVRAAALRDLQSAERIGGDAEKAEAYEYYESIKTGYSMAVQLMLGPAEGGAVKSAVKRPDWYHTIHAQHAANVWRDAWKVLLAGYEPVMMGSVDEVVYDSVDFQEIQGAGLLKVDLTGIQLGAFKVKHETSPAAAA